MSCVCVHAEPNYGGSASAGTQAKTLTIGAVLSLSGPASFPGEEVRRGLTLARDEINQDAARPLHVEILFEDSMGKAESGVRAFHKLKDTSTPDLFISMLSAVSVALSYQAEQSRVPLLVLVSSAPSVTAGKTWTFRYFPTAKAEIAAVADRIAQLPAKRLGLLYLEDEFGVSIKEELTALSKTLSGTLIAESFLGSDTDFRAQLLKLKSAHVDALYLVGLNSQLLIAVTQVEQLKFNIPIFGPSTFSDPEVRGAMRGISFRVHLGSSAIYDREDSASAAFRAAYRKQYGSEPSHSAANGYGALFLIVAAARKATAARPDRLRAGLAELKNYRDALGEVQIDSQRHEFAFPLAPAVLKKGELEFGSARE